MEASMPSPNRSGSSVLVENVGRGEVVNGLINQARSLCLSSFLPPTPPPFLRQLCQIPRFHRVHLHCISQGGLSFNRSGLLRVCLSSFRPLSFVTITSDISDEQNIYIMPHEEAFHAAGETTR